MKRTPLRKKSRNIQELLKDADRCIKNLGESKKLKDFFTTFWNELPVAMRRCWSCGQNLYEPIKNYYFDHLLEKSSRPDLALEGENIFLCCLDCHTKKTNGHPTKKHKEAIEKAKEMFGIVAKSANFVQNQIMASQIPTIQALVDEPRELTYGEKAVGLTFNPGGNSNVNIIKLHYAGVIQNLYQLREETSNPEVKRMLSVAITEAQTSQMWAVKAVTWQY